MSGILNGRFQLQIDLELFAVAVLLMILIATTYVLQNKREAKSVFFLMLMLCNILLLISDVISWCLMSCNDYGVLFKVNWVVCYALLMANLISFHGYFYESTKGRVPFRSNYFKIIIPYAVVCLIVWASSLKTEIMYTFDYSYKYGYQYGKYFVLAQVFLLGPLAIDYIYMLIRGRAISVREKLVWITYGLFPTLGILLESRFATVYTYCSLSLSVILLYSVTIIERERSITQIQLKSSQIQYNLIVSQIQPHFLYNALASISQLCRKDPKQAEIAIDKFSDYLRMNLDSLRREEAVPFWQELEHIDTYIWLEKMRFQDRLRFVKEIEIEDFDIPVLTLQAFVENAVRHGIVPRKEGGTVSLITKDLQDSYQIIIKDDGVGFDVDSISNQDQLPNGIANIKRRLDLYNKADVHIDSRIGEGCTVTITVKKGV